ncbi:hypothetical protein CHU00_18255 [Sphingobacterium cellulitidis]|uniref:hypothetical protein n=1 Tax=Sphingobacterium cellulitidis TaxID=1768011 RepID=UPI000B9422E0|nr:hypothetical protein [Sphingobacterium cellulitidis]OYD44197.1 hypothetical protein CHU00_18255 [Sphingobacterium cellulitidis]
MKKLSSIVLATMFAMVGFAKEPVKGDPWKTNFMANKAFQESYDLNHWFVGANVGAQIYFGDHDKQLSVGKRITPQFEVYAGKWLDEKFGVRLGVNGINYKGLTQTQMYSTGKVFHAGQGLEYQDFKYINVHADFMFNWTNDALGYDPQRLYNLIPYVGIGFGAVLSDPGSVKFSPNLGLLQSFRLTNALDLTLDIRGNLYGDEFDGEAGGRNFEGAVSTSVGVKYTLNR